MRVLAVWEQEAEPHNLVPSSPDLAMQQETCVPDLDPFLSIHCSSSTEVLRDD